jgi:signal peptidase II
MADLRRLGLIIAVALFVADQLLKYVVTGPLGLTYEGQQIHVLPFFDLTLVFNRGISLGLFTADAAWQRWLLVALTAAVAGFVAYWMWRETVKSDVWALGLILGGALGNIVDRVRFGHVVDFLDLHIGDFRPFLVFNLADAAITIGVLILLARAVLVREPKPEAESENA